jgi:hypothetical protein
MAREAVECAVIGGSVDAPEASVADVGEPRAELCCAANKMRNGRPSG